MRRFEEIKGTLAKHKQELRRDFGVKQIGVFGSYVRGEQKKQSDIDLLVEFEEPSNLNTSRLHQIGKFIKRDAGCQSRFSRKTNS